MKKTIMFTLVTLFIILIFLSACQNTNKSTLPNPLVGTWKFLEVVDSTGTAIEFYKGEVEYETLLEDGTWFCLSFRKNFPRTEKNPSTLEDYQEIFKNCQGRMGTYTVDIENKKAHLKYSHDLHPKYFGHEYTVNYKIAGDTATYWFDNSKNIYKYLRVK